MAMRGPSTTKPSYCIQSKIIQSSWKRKLTIFIAGPLSVDGLVALLKDTPPVKSAESRLKMRPGMFLGGLYNPTPKLISIELNNVSFAESLNAIAARQAKAIWRYGEDTEAGEYYLRFMNR
jgi:hypothetical protein